MPVPVRVNRWADAGIGSVNTFWLETDDVIIVIDGQRELSKARQVKCEIDAVGKPIVAVFLTHPHPDHFGGIGVFAPPDSGVPVYGSRQTRDSIAEDRFGLVKASHEVVGADFPEDVTLPDRFLIDGETLNIAGLEIQAMEWGAGEAECMTILYLPEQKLLFVADLIQHQMTAFLLEGRSGAWLAQLSRLRTAFPDVEMVYPGHGQPGPLDALVDAQSAYISAFRASVEAERVGGGLPEGGAARVASAMEQRYPGYLPVAAIPDLLVQDAAPIAKELSAAE